MLDTLGPIAVILGIAIIVFGLSAVGENTRELSRLKADCAIMQDSAQE